jgi:hypothetical protein
MVKVKKYVINDLINELNYLVNDSDISEIDIYTILEFEEIGMIHFDEEAKDPLNEVFFIDHIDMGYTIVIPPNHWIPEDPDNTWFYAEKTNKIITRVIEY